MRYSTVIISLAGLTSASSLKSNFQFKRQNPPANVFIDMTFEQLSISAGLAGNAAQKAADKLAGFPVDLTTVTEFDQEFLKHVNTVCNQAERTAFDPAIVAHGTTPGKEALEIDCGKTANKILRGQANIMRM